MKIRIIDGSNIVLILWNVALIKYREPLQKAQSVNDTTTINFYLQKIFEHFWWLFFKKLKQFYIDANQVVFCFEGKNSTEWRKSIYSDYKGNRHHDSDFLWTSVIQLFNEVKDICQFIPAKSLAVDNCEADDCIYTVALIESKNNPNSEIEIWSSDRDLVQVMNYFSNVKVYHPIQKKFREKEKFILEEKAIVGDGSDNIRGLPKIGPKTFEKMIESEEEWTKRMSKDNNLEEYERCLKIIDLRNCPFIEKIEKEYLFQKINKFDPKGLENFLRKKSLRCFSLYEFINLMNKKPLVKLFN